MCSQKVTEGRQEESSIFTAKFHLLSGVTLFVSFEKTMKKDEISDLIEFYIHFISIHMFIFISEQGPCLLLPALPYTTSYNADMCTNLKKPATSSNKIGIGHLKQILLNRDCICLNRKTEMQNHTRKKKTRKC